MPNPVKSLLYILSVTVQVAPDLLKDLARSPVDREDLKPYRKSEKGHISLGDQQSYHLQVFQILY